MKTLLKLLLCLLLLAVAGAAGGYFWFQERSNSQPLSLTKPELTVTIERGTGLRALGAILRRQGVNVQSWELELAARLQGVESKLKSGVYAVASPITLNGLLNKLVSGDVIQLEAKLIEGWTFKQFRAALKEVEGLKQLTAQMSDAQILQAVGATEAHPEGLFFPDTYKFSPGQSDLDILNRAYKEMSVRVSKVWEARPADTPLKTPYELLSLASIVEKETGLEADRDKVAAVFINRLKIGMRLQSDPTTIYGMGEAFKGNIRRKDLETDTPYNTYTRAGITPTPIAMPGQNSLRAVIAPANISALYFVARGDGTSEFSDDLAAHNRAVDRYQRRRQPTKSPD